MRQNRSVSRKGKVRIREKSETGRCNRDFFRKPEAPPARTQNRRESKEVGGARREKKIFRKSTRRPQSRRVLPRRKIRGKEAKTIFPMPPEEKRFPAFLKKSPKISTEAGKQYKGRKQKSEERLRKRKSLLSVPHSKSDRKSVAKSRKHRQGTGSPRRTVFEKQTLVS